MDNDIISTEYKDALFAVLRSVLHDEKLTLSKDIDADRLIRIAAHQNLFPLIFSCLMQRTNFADTEVYIKYLPAFYAEFSAQVKRTEAFLKLYPQFTDKGIYPIVVKGIICRELYGDFAESRPSGDEDLFVSKSEFFEAAKILEENGFVPERDDITEKQLDTFHHLAFNKKDFMIELHANLLDYRNGLRAKMNGYFNSAANNAIDIKIKEVTVRTLNHTDHFLYLIFHAFEHFVLAGVGIRQMTDILLYYQKYSTDIDMNYIVKALEDTNSKYFLSDMIHIGNKYLGFSFESLYEEKDSEALLEDMLKMGVFGNSTNEHLAAGQMTSAALEGGNTMLKTIFPTRQWLSRRFPELEEKPYLLPVCWVKRWMIFLKQGKNKDMIGGSMAVGKRRLELLKKYEIV